jgi:UDP-glucose 4-epimerase
MKDPRILVTGGAGFIGSELVRQLVAKGESVLVVDNLVNGRRENLEGVDRDRLWLEVADVRNQPYMHRLARGIETVFHLACLGVRHSIRAPEENHEVNATGTLRVLLAAHAAGVKRFVYVSSSEVYGTAREVPMSEEHPAFPNTVYGASKLAGECYTRAFWETYRFPTVIVRPFNSYGPRSHHEGDCGEVIPKFMLRSMAGRPMIVFGDGSQTRDFTYVGDTARGILQAGLVNAAIGETINLGSGRELRIEQLAKKIAAAVSRADVAIVHDDPRPGDVLRLCSDSSKAHELLGFEAVVSLDEGLRKLSQWYVEQGEPPEVSLEREIERNWEPRTNQVGA